MAVAYQLPQIITTVDVCIKIFMYSETILTSPGLTRTTLCWLARGFKSFFLNFFLRLKYLESFTMTVWA